MAKPTQHREHNDTNTTLPMQGSRIINLNHLTSFVNNISAHSQSCKGNVSFDGLWRPFSVQNVATSCRLEIAFSTSTKIDGVDSRKHWECNLAAVWGQMCAGSGQACLKETASVLGIPTMTEKAFVATESAIDKCWWQSRDESMKGREEVTNGERVLS